MSAYKNFPSLLMSLPLCVMLATIPAWANDTQVADTHRLSQAEVVKIAIDFCQSIGRPSLKLDEILTPVAYKKVDILNSHWHPHWRVRMTSSSRPKGTAEVTEVEVDDLNGDIVAYEDMRNMLSTEVAEASAIPKSEAVTQATDALTRAGAFRSGELKFDQVFFTPITRDEAGNRLGDWAVTWDRVVKGVPYRHEGANVTVNAATGAVTGFGIVFHTPPPDRADFRVSKEQATAIASQQLALAGLTPPAPPTVKAEVLRPNTFWRPGGSDSDEASYARLAWTVRYESHDRASHSCEVWVDAQTGDVIGGEYAGSQNGLTISGKAAKRAAPGRPAPAAMPSAPPRM